MSKLIPISEAAKLLGVHAETLRRWERDGKIKPRRTSGNLRRYDIADIRPDLHLRSACGFAQDRLCAGFKPRPKGRFRAAKAGS